MLFRADFGNWADLVSLRTPVLVVLRNVRFAIISAYVMLVLLGFHIAYGVWNCNIVSSISKANKPLFFGDIFWEE